eukprot:TRINITY_DN3368_c0_g1_i1.p1 TRINITY_DN3368_c0_g1~~TRINITY_DN3368_c0_g1_i1.p1  ORF type:complete len:108 (+),score=14.86 TRINITY_DN3368_c0_g1_i1:99-422(+)
MQRGLVGSEMCIRDRYNYYQTSCKFASQFPGYSELNCVTAAANQLQAFTSNSHLPVSYTHLTLPTILLVQISVVAVSLKKKKKQTAARSQLESNTATGLRLDDTRRA